MMWSEAGTSQYWRDLCPGLSVTNEELAPGFAVNVPREHWQLADEQMRAEGYFHLPPVIDPKVCAKLAACVQDVVGAGFPSPFALVYDDFWKLLPDISSLLGDAFAQEGNYLVLPDFWIWHVDGRDDNSSAGWSAHRDFEKEGQLVTSDGTPLLATAWVSLTNATPLNSCIYLMPTDKDPHVPGNLDSVLIPPGYEQFVRAVPAPAGSVLGWNQHVLHWGSAGSRLADQPRISMAFYLQHPDAALFDVTNIDLESGVPFEDRLGIIGRMLLNYQRDGFSEEALQFADRYHKLFLASTKVAAMRRNATR